MKYKKFLLIPVLIFIYIFFIVNLLISYSPNAYSESSQNPTGGGQVIDIGTAVSVSVTRSYLLGLVRLPIYSDGIGYIGNIHNAFFVFIGILIIVFIVLELIQWRKK